MKLFEVVSSFLREAVFTPRNFPAAPNKHIVGAGERTVYGELPVNYPGGEGFRVIKPTKVVRGKQDVTELKPDTRIFWTLPGKLFSANELGEKGTSNYAMFGLTSNTPRDAVGFIPISSVEKPSKIPGRVLSGKVGQEQVFEHLAKTYSDKFESIIMKQTAGIGSTKADLVVAFDGQEAQFEIKTTSSKTAPITFFDKTVRRDKPSNLIDGLVAAMSGRPRMTLVKMIDRQRLKDKTIGFPGDKGVGKSGKFIGLRIHKDNDNSVPAWYYIIDHFIENKDNYFAVNYGGGNVSIYYTGYGENILDAPNLPVPEYIDLRTYGGPSAGGMRVGVKVKL